MHVAYVDDAGDVQTLPVGGGGIQPVLAFGAIVVDANHVPPLTLDYLALKRQVFGGLMTSPHLLDHILVEIKGADLRAMIRSGGQDHRRAVHFLLDLVTLLEAYDARICGRVWVKGFGQPVNGRAVNTYSIQAICETFEHYLDAINDNGIIIIDSSTPGINSSVSHSVFTRRFSASGDVYSHLFELPTFGHSKNHAGLQIADNITSGLLVPMACRTYCRNSLNGPHVHASYDELKLRFGRRLRSLQHRYTDAAGMWRGGITVSDALGHLHGGHLFHTMCGTQCTP